MQFLRDQYEVEERVAREATAGPWRNAPTPRHHATATGKTEEAVFAAPPDKGAMVVASTGEGRERQNLVNAEHIARHSPARVLAEIAAKRRLLELHAVRERGDGCVVCDDGNDSCGCLSGPSWGYPCDTVKTLALPYADHPAYRDEWRP